MPYCSLSVSNVYSILTHKTPPFQSHEVTMKREEKPIEENMYSQTKQR